MIRLARHKPRAAGAAIAKFLPASRLSRPTAWSLLSLGSCRLAAHSAGRSSERTAESAARSRVARDVRQPRCSTSHCVGCTSAAIGAAQSRGHTVQVPPNAYGTSVAILLSVAKLVVGFTWRRDADSLSNKIPRRAISSAEPPHQGRPAKSRSPCVWPARPNS